MKRWNEIAFLLLPAVLAAVLAGCAPAAESGDACVFAGGRSAVEAYAPDAAADSGRMAFDRGGTVDYTYRLTYYEDDAARVGVELAFTVRTPSGEYALSAAGDVERTVLNDRFTLLKGPLWGSGAIDGTDYTYSAGFAKLEQSDAISVGLTLTSGEPGGTQLYRFGTPVVTGAVRDAVSAYQARQAEPPPESDAADAEFEFYDAAEGDLLPAMPSAAEGVGCTLTGFRDDENARVMLTLQSNCGGFAPWDFPSGEWIGAYVHSFTIGLERTSDRGFIAGIEEIGLPGSGSTGAPYTKLGSAEEQLALLPAPYHAAAATAGAVLAAEASPATVEIAKSMTHHRWVTATMDEAGTLNLDAAPIPVVFQLGSSVETPVTFVGNAYGQITYAIDLWSAGFYIPTEVAAFPVAMTLR